MPAPDAGNAAEPLSPLTDLAEARDRRPPADGMALALSGGGYRAMLFHTGVVWRLYEAGLLAKLKRISSVSGGSIIAALLGLKWSRIVGSSATHDAFVDEVVNPIRALARVSVDVAAGAKGTFFPGTISHYVARAYAKHLFGDATLQDLPDAPRFVINATNIQSAALWRFSKPYMRDYLVGNVTSPKVLLADAVAASSAFPPFLSPAQLSSDVLKFEPPAGEPLHRSPYTTDVYLTDGGVYDNLGLETIWKRYQTLLVSDGGQKIVAEPEPHTGWLRHTKRILDIVDNQVRSLRKRQLIEAYRQGVRSGVYWSIRSDIADYGVPSLACPVARTLELAAVPTRLSATDDDTQERIINWGFAICDAALRAWVDRRLPQAARFPYPAAAV